MQSRVPLGPGKFYVVVLVPLWFMARALCAWAINRRGKNSVRNLRYGPQTRLVRCIKKFQILSVFSLPWSLEKKDEKREWVTDECFFAIEKIETVNLTGNVPHKLVLSCATVVSFPIARAERKTCLPRFSGFCPHPLCISQAFCSLLVIGQEASAMQANQHKQNYLIVCFCCSSIIIVSQQHFWRPGWKKSTGV